MEKARGVCAGCVFDDKGIMKRDVAVMDFCSRVLLNEYLETNRHILERVADEQMNGCA